MLSRKFGKEVANYFSGSPLNRVGFLRGDNVFLSTALRHSTTKFLLCKDLQPLVSDPKQPKLAYVKYEDVKPIIGENPYEQTEDEKISTYNSKKHIPQMIFLGLDDRVPDALAYENKKNIYKGAPYFALDVTPRASVTESCKEVIEKQEKNGLSFAQGRVMDIPAQDGMPQ